MKSVLKLYPFCSLIDIFGDSDLSSSTSSPILYDNFDPYFTDSSENSYSSDQGSGNEDAPDLNFPFDLDNELEFV